MTWFKEAIERRTFSPFQITQTPIHATVEGALFVDMLQIAQTSFDSFKLHRKKTVDAGARWNIYQEEREWDRIHLRFQLSIAEPDLFEQMPCMYGVHAMCKKTRWRKAETGTFRNDSAIIELAIPKADVAGEVLISPLILHAGDENGSGLRGKRLAGGFPISLLIDPPGEKFGAGMEIRWFPFPQDQNGSLFYLDLESESPLLLINKSHLSMKSIFEDRSKAGTRFRLRNALFSFIAVDVWLQLAQFAGDVARLEIDDDLDPKVVLSRKIIRSLMKMVKLREDQIQMATQEPSERAYLHRLLQHHFQLAGHQDALVASFVEEPAQ